MRHKFLVLTVKKLLKSVYIYGSYRKNRVITFFGPPGSCKTDAVLSEVHDQWVSRKRRRRAVSLQ